MGYGKDFMCMFMDPEYLSLHKRSNGPLDWMECFFLEEVSWKQQRIILHSSSKNYHPGQ